MSLAPTQARIMMNTAYKSDLEFAIQMIAQKKTSLAYQAAAAAENYPELAAQYQFLDKKLETEMITLETQLKIVTTEEESLKKTLEEDVKSFKYA